MSPLAMIQWHPRLAPIWCGVLLLGAGAWGWLIYQRLSRRLSPGPARWLAAPKLLVLGLLLLAFLDPVSALRKVEPATGKVLALVDSSSSMDVADDYHQPRGARARAILERWKKALPPGIKLDELEFDTSIHPPARAAGSQNRGTDLGGCLLALSERADIASYLGIVMLTDGGDETLENPALPKVPLSIVGVGTDPAGWNDLALTDVQAPATAELDADFEITADIQARAGHGGGFGQSVARVRVLLQRSTPGGWENLRDESVELSGLRGRARLTARSGELGVQHYRVTVESAPGELSALNNSRPVSVNVRKKGLRVLYYTLRLGQEFKVLRNELARDPGISFAALFRTAGDRFTLQSDRDDTLARGFPETKEGLKDYDVIIVGSFPAQSWTPSQMQALIQFVDGGGTLVFLGGENSFGRGGYAETSLAVLFPWRLSGQEPEMAQGSFPVRVPPMASGHPILATVGDTLSRITAKIDSVNLAGELKPNATPLLTAQVGGTSAAIVAVQPFGSGKVMGIASDTLWRWAMQPEPLRSAYGLFWRQAARNLSGKSEGGQNLSVRWDKDFYRPGDQAIGEIRAPGGGVPRFSASLAVKGQTTPVEVEPPAGQTGVYQVKLRFHERGDYGFRLVAYQADRVLETYEKAFPIAPLRAEGTRLELDEGFLKKLADQGGGEYFREDEADEFIDRLAGHSQRKMVLEESSLAEAGPWFALAFLAILVFEWIMRRKAGLF